MLKKYRYNYHNYVVTTSYVIMKMLKKYRYNYHNYVVTTSF